MVLCVMGRMLAREYCCVNAALKKESHPKVASPAMTT